MAHSSGLATAAFLARNEIDLQVTELEWPKLFNLPVFDFEVSINLNGHRHIGRGTALEKSQAIDSAIGEAFERSVSQDSQVESYGGIAVHLTEEHARAAAVAELIERDTFFAHFLTSTPFASKVDIASALPALGNEFVKLCEKNNILIDSYKMTAPLPFHAVIVIARGIKFKKPFGIRIGLGCTNESLSMAVEKATLELMRMIADILLNENLATMDSQTLMNEIYPNPQSHIQWALHPDSADTLNPCLHLGSNANSVTSPPMALDPNLISTAAVPRPAFWPSIIPLVVVRAQHPTAISTFFGSSARGMRFQKRLGDFSRRNFQKADLPLFPHPLG